MTQHIADSAHGVNQRRLEIAVYLVSQISDIDVDNIGEAVKALVPYVLDDHVTGTNLALVCHQVFEQHKFLDSKIDGFARPRDFPAQAIQYEVRNLQLVPLLRRSSAKQGFRPHDQLSERKRLGQIVVAALLEMHQLVRQCIARRQYQYW